MNESERHERRVRLKTGLLLVVVFLSGAIVGGAVLRWIGEPMGPGPGELGPPMSFLGLSSEQEAKAAEILARHRPEIEAVVQDAMPKIRAIQERIEEEFKPFLTPEQKRLLENQIEKYGRPPPMPMGSPLEHSNRP